MLFFCGGCPTLLEARHDVLKAVFTIDDNLRKLHALLPGHFLVNILYRLQHYADCRKILR
jgi:hypothetical protein